MSRFLTPLDVRLKDEARGIWCLDGPLVYESDRLGRVVGVPAGFCTDFASVPRAPVAYLLAGGVAQSPAVIHDYLYTTGEVPRRAADDVFLEAMAVTGVPAWRRLPMYIAVRAFGSSRFVR